MLSWSRLAPGNPGPSSTEGRRVRRGVTALAPRGVRATRAATVQRRCNLADALADEIVKAARGHDGEQSLLRPCSLSGIRRRQQLLGMSQDAARSVFRCVLDGGQFAQSVDQ